MLSKHVYLSIYRLPISRSCQGRKGDSREKDRRGGEIRGPINLSYVAELNKASHTLGRRSADQSVCGARVDIHAGGVVMSPDCLAWRIKRAPPMDNVSTNTLAGTMKKKDGKQNAGRRSFSAGPLWSRFGLSMPFCTRGAHAARAAKEGGSVGGSSFRRRSKRRGSRDNRQG